MLTHLKPQDPKNWKNGKSTNTVKRRGFWRPGEVGGRGRGPSLLRRGENCRTARTRPGGPWPDYNWLFKRLHATAGQGPNYVDLLLLVLVVVVVVAVVVVVVVGDKKTSSLSCLPAAKAHTWRLRQTETAGP